MKDDPMNLREDVELLTPTWEQQERRENLLGWATFAGVVIVLAVLGLCAWWGYTGLQQLIAENGNVYR